MDVVRKIGAAGLEGSGYFLPVLPSIHKQEALKST